MDAQIVWFRCECRVCVEAIGSGARSCAEILDDDGGVGLHQSDVGIRAGTRVPKAVGKSSGATGCLHPSQRFGQRGADVFSAKITEPRRFDRLDERRDLFGGWLGARVESRE